MATSDTGVLMIEALNHVASQLRIDALARCFHSAVMKMFFHTLLLTALGLSVVSIGVRASEPTPSPLAVGDEGRVIGLATSKDLRGENTKP